MSKNFFDYTVKDATRKDLPLSNYKGKVIIAVNVASKCGFTPQYTGLESLFKKYHEQGLVILGFPCNQFGFQEPGTNDEIQQFCSTTYNVTFPVLDKVDVNGAQAAPVFEFMKTEIPGILGTEMIKWNFTKFLIGRDGKVLKRFAPQDKPEDMEKEIEAALQRGPN